MNKTGDALRRIADAVMDASRSICSNEDEEDGTYYVPFVLICAINDFNLIGSTLHFEAHQPPEEIARLLRMTADQLDAAVPPPPDRGGYLQ